MMNIVVYPFTIWILAVHAEDGWRTEGPEHDKVDIGWNKSPCKSEAEFYETKGMGRVAHENVKRKLWTLKTLLAHKYGFKVVNDTNSTMSDDMIDDAVFNEHQLDVLLAQLTHRKRRNVLDFNAYPAYKWNIANPIQFIFDGSHSTNARTVIRGAIAHWQQNTCIRFIEVTRAPSTNSYLIFSSVTDGCYSLVGRQSTPQIINLNSNGCLDSIAVSAHEIGHALGLFHEQSRIDRDDHVQIHRSNSYLSDDRFAVNFAIETFPTSTYNVPYDYSSVMHYGAMSFSIIYPRYTITSIDPLYMSTMGQRAGLSFFDTLLVNKAYCSGVCTRSLSCQRGGYTDPKNCAACHCPDGFGGTLCERVATNGAQCGSMQQEFNLNSKEQDGCITNPPGYGTPYPLYVTCNWLIKSPPGSQIQFYFPVRMYLLHYKNDISCHHWVEIKLSANTQFPGPRFCEYDTTPDATLTSETNEVAVIFKTNYPLASSNLQYMLGFKLCFRMIGGELGLRNSVIFTSSSSLLGIVTLVIASTGVYSS